MPPKGKKTPNRSKSPKKSDDSKSEASFFATNLNEVFYTCFKLTVISTCFSVDFFFLTKKNWNSLIACLVPSNEYDELYIEQLEKSVKNGLRRRFTWFSKKDLIEMVKFKL